MKSLERGMEEILKLNKDKPMELQIVKLQSKSRQIHMMEVNRSEL